MKDVRLTHIGGPTLLIEVGGWRILTDPTLVATLVAAGARRIGDFDWPSSARTQLDVYRRATRAEEEDP